jgi:hypothetical protein
VLTGLLSVFGEGAAASSRAGEPPPHVHHHWHGVTAEDIAAIIRQQEDQ